MTKPPKELWAELRSAGLYTKGYDQFVEQYGSPENMEKLRQRMSQDGLTKAKNAQELQDEYGPKRVPSIKENRLRREEEEKKLQVKKPVEQQLEENPYVKAPIKAPTIVDPEVTEEKKPVPESTPEIPTVKARINDTDANIPLDVPWLTKPEKEHLAFGLPPTDIMLQKAAEYAASRPPKNIDKPWTEDVWDAMKTASKSAFSSTAGEDAFRAGIQANSRSALGFMYKAAGEVANMTVHGGGATNPNYMLIQQARAKGIDIGPGAAMYRMAGEQKEKANAINAKADTESPWYFVGAIVPYTAGTVAAILTAPVSLPVSGAIGTASVIGLGAVSFGSGLDAYDEYKAEKGDDDIDPLARIGVGALYGAAEMLFERYALSKLVPKGVKGRMGEVMFGGAPGEIIEKSAKELLEQFAKVNASNAQLVKNVMRGVAKGGIVEGETEVLTELGQKLADFIYLNQEDWTEHLRSVPKDAAMALLGGVLMGVGMGPLSFGSQSIINKQRREKNGKVVITQNKETGEAVEVLGISEGGKDKPLVYSVVRPNGKTETLAEDKAGQIVTLTPQQFDLLLKGKFDARAIEASMTDPNVPNMVAYGDNLPPVQIGETVLGEDGVELTVTGQTEDGWVVEDESGEQEIMTDEDLQQIRKRPEVLKKETADVPDGAEELRNIFSPGDNMYRDATIGELLENVTDEWEQIGVRNTHTEEIRKAIAEGDMLKHIKAGDITEERARQIADSVGLLPEFESMFPKKAEKTEKVDRKDLVAEEGELQKESEAISGDIKQLTDQLKDLPPAERAGVQKSIDDLKARRQEITNRLADIALDKYIPEVAEATKPAAKAESKSEESGKDKIEAKRKEAKDGIRLFVGAVTPLTKDPGGNDAAWGIIAHDENGKFKYPELRGIEGATKEEVESKIDAIYDAELAALEKPEPKAEPKAEPKDPEIYKVGDGNTTIIATPIDIEGIEHLDTAVGKKSDGDMTWQVIEIVTGGVIAEGFSREEAINNAKNDPALKKIDYQKISDKIYQGKFGKGIRKLNGSEKYNKFLAEKKAKRDATPLLYTPEEIEKITALADRLPDSKEFLLDQLDRREGEGIKISIEFLEKKANGDFDKEKMPSAAVIEEDIPQRLSVAEKKARALSKARNIFEKQKKAIENSSELFKEERIAEIESSYAERVKQLEDRYDKQLDTAVDAEAQAIYDEALKGFIEEIKSKKLTHVSGLGMGANQAIGTYISTEQVNRYSGERLPTTVEVDIENPFISTDDPGFVETRMQAVRDNIEQFTPEDFIDENMLPVALVPKNFTIENLSSKGLRKAAELVTKNLQDQGYDSIYFPESDTQEGELIVFDRAKVRGLEEAKPVEAKPPKPVEPKKEVAETRSVKVSKGEFDVDFDSDGNVIEIRTKAGKVIEKYTMRRKKGRLDDMGATKVSNPIYAQIENEALGIEEGEDAMVDRLYNEAERAGEFEGIKDPWMLAMREIARGGKISRESIAKEFAGESEVRQGLYLWLHGMDNKGLSVEKMAESIAEEADIDKDYEIRTALIDIMQSFTSRRDVRKALIQNKLDEIRIAREYDEMEAAEMALAAPVDPLAQMNPDERNAILEQEFNQTFEALPRDEQARALGIEPEVKEYKFELQLRPFNQSPYPKDAFVRFEQTPGSRHGHIVLNRPLTTEEIQRYELTADTQVEALNGKTFTDADGYYSAIEVKWDSNRTGTVTMYDQAGKIVGRPFGMSSIDILKNLEQGYWKIKEIQNEGREETNNRGEDRSGALQDQGVQGVAKEKARGVSEGQKALDAEANLRKEEDKLAKMEVAAAAPQAEMFEQAKQEEMFGGFGKEDLPAKVLAQRKVVEDARREAGRLREAADKAEQQDQVQKEREKAQAEGQIEIPDKPKRERKVRDEKLRDEIDNLWDQFGKDLRGGGLTMGGVNPKALETGVKIVTKYTEAGVYKFKDIIEDAYAKIGDALETWFNGIKQAYAAARMAADKEARSKMDTTESIEDLEYSDIIKNQEDVSGRGNDVAPDLGVRDQVQPGKEAVPGDGPGRGDRTGRESASQEGGVIEGDNAVPGSVPAFDRAVSNSGLSGRSSGIQPGFSGSTHGPGGSGVLDDARIPSEREATGGVKAVAPNSGLNEKIALQKKAESIKVIPGDADNISQTLPLLRDVQLSNVLKAEKRFAVGKGFLIGDRTGVGKGLSGLGVIKRMVKQGKGRIIIVVPGDQKAEDWISEGSWLGLSISRLADTKDAGSGVVITTYANYAANEAITNDDWDAVVYDEAHKLMTNEAGKSTARFEKHKRIANLPSSVWQRMTNKYRDLLNHEDYRIRRDAKERAIAEGKALTEKTKVLYLSATPFARISNLRIGDGSLFDITETWARIEAGESATGAWNDFMVKTFGYRIRYSKLTIPESGVDMGLMERQFADNLTKDGVKTATALTSDQDYSREFVLLANQVGSEIDRGIMLANTEFRGMRDLINKKFNYLYTARLLEAIKAKEMVPRIRKHLDMGRQVVLFHNYNEGLPSHPFDFSDVILEMAATKEDPSTFISNMESIVSEFNQKYPEFSRLPMQGLMNPIATMSAAFGPAVGFYNGQPQTKKIRGKNIEKFTAGTLPIIVIQIEAGKEGINLQDKKGDRQRVLINLGLPTAPTDAIQSEGRIIRFGAKSHGILEYGKLGFAYETRAFAEKVSERSQTAENLNLGSQARGLDLAFREGFMNPSNSDPNTEQGVGGKEADTRLETGDTFDLAKTIYWAKSKRTAATKSQEGVDYFATPEPIGLKMVDFLHLQPNEKALEPSAGDGAIARWLPNFTSNTAIEPSYHLSADLALNAETSTVERLSFEDHHIINKYDGIAMNPPFGTAGKTAMEHVDKAFKHLREGGRIVAIVPTGKMNDRLTEWLAENPSAQLRKRVLLPGTTFKRAGTGVYTQMIVIDKDNVGDPVMTGETDLTDMEDIKDLFDAFKEMSMPPRPQAKPATRPLAALTQDRGAIIGEKKDGSQNYENVDTKHTATGADLFVTKIIKNLPTDQYIAVSKKAKDHGGYYSRFTKGFNFQTAEQRQKFIDEVFNGAQFSMPDVVNGFYSPLEKIISETKLDRLPAKQWIEKFAKGEEAKWTGLTDWLNEQTGSVSKDDIQKYLKENRIEIKEVVKVSNEATEKSKEEKLEDIRGKMRQYGNYNMERDMDGSWYVTENGEMLLEEDEQENLPWQVKNLAQEFYEVAEESRTDEGETQYSGYQLEGEKSNYKEVLVTLPVKYKNLAEYAESKGISSIELNYKLPYGSEALKKLRDEFNSLTKFRSSHWSEPNILVHLRMNTRIDADGKKVLFLEEIQSDWGQKGKKAGFDSKVDQRKELEKRGVTFNQNGTVSLKSQDEHYEKGETWNLIKRYNDTYTDKQIVPTAPFVTDTNAWAKLGLKVALKEAVRQGADKISWTTGEQQNDRYDLSKQVDSIEANRQGDGWHISALKDGQSISSMAMPAYTQGELENIVGKDLAQKIVDANIPDGKTKIYSGLDLKIGGKGMKGFYGNPETGSLGIVGNVAKSLFKQEPKTVEIDKSMSAKRYAINWNQWGMSDIHFTTKTEADKYYNAMKDGMGEGSVVIQNQELSTQHSIDITPELRESVSDGLPLFQQGTRGEFSALAQEAINRAQKAFPNVKITTDVAEIDEAKALMTAAGKMERGAMPLGFVLNGKVYIDPRVATVETPMHEFGHIWNTYTKLNNNPLFRKGLKLVKGTAYEARVRANKGYDGLSGMEILEEALALAIGEKGAELMAQSKFKRWLRDMWDSIKSILGFDANTTLGEFATMAAKQITSGKKVSGVTSEQVAEAQLRVQPMYLEEQSVTSLLGDVANATQAKDMEAIGLSMRQIEAATGWHKGPDGKWRRFVRESYSYLKQAGNEVDGFEVRDHVPNMSSIESTLTDYRIMRGIREFPLSSLAPVEFDASDDNKKVNALASQLDDSKSINPVIIVIDKDGPYVLEGAHRVAAMQKLGVTNIPAKVVVEDSATVGMNKTPANGDTLGDVMDIPHIYELYPEAKNIPIRVDKVDYAAGYNFKEIIISEKELDSPYLMHHILHEVQHYVQHQEGLIQPDNVMDLDAAEQTLWNGLGGKPDMWNDYSDSELLYALEEMHADMVKRNDPKRALAYMLISTMKTGPTKAYESQYAEVSAQASVAGYFDKEGIYDMLDTLEVNEADMWWYKSILDGKGTNIDSVKPIQENPETVKTIASMGYANIERMEKEAYLNSPAHDAMVLLALDAIQFEDVQTVQRFAVLTGQPLGTNLGLSFNQAMASLQIKADPWRAQMAMSTSQTYREALIDGQFGIDRLLNDIHEEFGTQTAFTQAKKALYKSAAEQVASEAIEKIIGPTRQSLTSGIRTAFKKGQHSAARVAPLTDKSGTIAYELELMGKDLNDLGLFAAAMHGSNRNARVAEMRSKAKERVLEHLSNKIDEAVGLRKARKADYARKLVEDVINDNYVPSTVPRRYSDLVLKEDGMATQSNNVENGSGLYDAEWLTIIDRFHNDKSYDKMKAILKKTTDLLRVGRLDMMLASGMINQKNYDALLNGTREGYASVLEDYVPLTVRDEMFGIDDESGGGTGVHGLVGTEKYDVTERNNPIATMMMQYVATARQVAKNDFVKEVAEQVAEANKEAAKVGKGSFIKLNSTASNRQAGTVDEQGRLVFNPGKDKIAENSVKYFVNGKVRYITFPQIVDQWGKLRKHPVVTAFENEDLPSWFDSAFIKTYMAIFNLRRMLLTQMNPWFALRNVPRDNQARFLHMTIFKEVGMWDTIMQEVKHVGPLGVLGGLAFKNKAIQAAMLRYEKAGGKMTWANAGKIGQDIDDMQTLIDSYYQGPVGGKRSAKYGNIDAAAMATKVLDLTGNFNDSMENSTRLSVFMAVERVLLKKGYTQEQATTYAANVAKNITVNFEQKGKAMKYLGMWKMFLNVAIQGVDLSWRSLRSGRAALPIAAIAMASALNRALLYYDSEDDEEENEEMMLQIYNGVDERSILVATPGKTPFRIPKGYGITRIPITIGENVVDMMHGYKTPGYAMMSLIGSLGQTLIPVVGELESKKTLLFPSLAEPIGAAWLNEAWYGKDIQPMFGMSVLETDPDGDETKRRPWRTSEIHKKFTAPWALGFAEALEKVTRAGGEQGVVDWSPDKIEYIYKQYTAGAVKESIDAIVEMQNFYEKGLDGVDLQKFPLTKTFGGKMRDDDKNKFYSILKLVSEDATSAITPKHAAFIKNNLEYLKEKKFMTNKQKKSFENQLKLKYAAFRS